MGVVVTLTAMFFTQLQVHSLAVVIVTALLTAALFSAAGLINGIYAKSFDDTSIVPTFVLAPLTYLGGIFFSIDMLPEFWQIVSKANPILYMVNGFRLGVLGVSDISLVTAFTVMSGLLIGLFLLALYLLRKGVGVRS